MTTVRFVAATAVKSQFLRHGLGPVSESRYPDPALLVSYWYWDRFADERQHYQFRDYTLDSGAFSAYHSGATIDLTEYIEFCRERLTTDPKCSEVFALDVIGDWRATIKNTETMWEAGVPAIPTYHVGSPTHVLKHIAKTYPKIALGGAVGMIGTKKIEWARQCFAHVWPKPIHGLGFGTERQLMAVPFHSVDATNWETGPARFGMWRSMPGASIRGGDQPLKMEVEWYLRLEERVRARWRREMAMLDEELRKANWRTTMAPDVRLAVVSKRAKQAFTPSKEEATP